MYGHGLHALHSELIQPYAYAYFVFLQEVVGPSWMPDQVHLPIGEGLDVVVEVADG